LQSVGNVLETTKLIFYHLHRVKMLSSICLAAVLKLLINHAVYLTYSQPPEEANSLLPRYYFFIL